MIKLIWVTPEAEKQILYMARVSSNDQNSNDTKLLKYLVTHGHWSPFEMCNMCVEIITSRAISAQILRHRSFQFQEFSQRYAASTTICRYSVRRQDNKNRQNSFADLSDAAKIWWDQTQEQIEDISLSLYGKALELGIAKECARMVLPMATETKLYMNGTLRSWIHYLNARCDVSTQLEHREIANKIKELFKEQFPIISEALGY